MKNNSLYEKQQEQGCYEVEILIYFNNFRNSKQVFRSNLSVVNDQLLIYKRLVSQYR